MAAEGSRLRMAHEFDNSNKTVRPGALGAVIAMAPAADHQGKS